MKNVTSEGKFIFPRHPSPDDWAELVVFVIDSSPQLKLEVARNHGVLIRGFDAFVTTCMAAGVSFEQCPVEDFAGEHLDAIAKKWFRSGKLFQRAGGRASKEGRLTRIFYYVAAKHLGDTAATSQDAQRCWS